MLPKPPPSSAWFRESRKTAWEALAIGFVRLRMALSTEAP
jgi:hypothetical protein